jgi:lipoprotein-anchoring transpeptidase ErfK/SrfK
VLRMLLAFVIALLIAAASGAAAEPLAMAPAGNLFAPFNQILREPGAREDITADELRRQVIEYPSREPAGTIIVDTAHTFLYFVLGGGKALRYGIGVGREGFTWSGVEAISRMAEWPDWNPPKEMIGRQPYLPRFMAGGPGNPLGARALYEDITDLYRRAKIGGKVIVLSAGRSLEPGAGPAIRRASGQRMSAIIIPH